MARDIRMRVCGCVSLPHSHVVYHGPVADSMAFFSSLGFICPPRKDVPSFLQEVTTPSGECVACMKATHTSGTDECAREQIRLARREGRDELMCTWVELRDRA